MQEHIEYLGAQLAASPKAERRRPRAGRGSPRRSGRGRRRRAAPPARPRPGPTPAGGSAPPGPSVTGHVTAAPSIPYSPARRTAAGHGSSAADPQRLDHPRDPEAASSTSTSARSRARHVGRTTRGRTRRRPTVRCSAVSVGRRAVDTSCGRAAARTGRRARPAPRRRPAATRRRAARRPRSAGAGCRSPCTRAPAGGRTRTAARATCTSASTGFVTTTRIPWPARRQRGDDRGRGLGVVAQVDEPRVVDRPAASMRSMTPTTSAASIFGEVDDPLPTPGAPCRDDLLEVHLVRVAPSASGSSTMSTRYAAGA